MKLKPIASIFCSIVFSTIAFASTANNHLDEILAYCDNIDELEKNFQAFALEGGCTHEELSLITPEVKEYCAAKRALTIQQVNEAEQTMEAFKSIIANVKSKLERNTPENLYDIFSSSEQTNVNPELTAYNYYNRVYAELSLGYDLVPKEDVDFTELVFSIATDLGYCPADFDSLMQDPAQMHNYTQNYHKILLGAVATIEAYIKQLDLVDQFKQENPPA